MAALLALISALVWGVADFVGGFASRKSTPLQTLILTTPAGMLFIIPIALLLGGNRSGSLIPGVAAGVCGAFGILLLYLALSAGPMGVLSPISAVLGAAIPVVVGLFRGERPGVLAYVGMALAVVAIITVGLEPSNPTDDGTHQRVTPRALAYALGAGVGIGLFFAFVGLAPTDASLWPVVFARTTSTIVLVSIAIIVARRNKAPLLPPETITRWQSIGAGVLDVAANGFYVLAAHLGMLSVVAVLGSLYPAATVFLARFVLAERLRPIQIFGMLTALVASALLALG